MQTYDLIEAAGLLRMSPAVLRRKARAGEVRAAKPGKCWVFLEADLVDYLHALYAGSGQAPHGGCKENTLWHFTDAATPGGSASRPPAASAYTALLGLPTGRRPRNSTTG
jgi:hypothetical protein